MLHGAMLEEAQLDGGLRDEHGRGLRRRRVDAADQRREPREVLFEHVEHRRRVERGCRVVDRVEEHAAAAERDFLLLAVDARDAGGLPERSLVAKLPSVATTFGWMSSTCRKRWPSQASISSGCGSRFPGGPALENVRDVDVAALEADPREQLVEQLPGLADEREALLVLVEAGRLADEHQVGVGVADAEDDLRAALGEPAAGAAPRPRLERSDSVEGASAAATAPAAASAPG